jgi:hypothetical protein
MKKPRNRAHEVAEGKNKPIAKTARVAVQQNGEVQPPAGKARKSKSE